MKKKFLLVLSFVVLFVGASYKGIYAQEYIEEQITNFVSDVTFNEDATIDIKEEIHYYFPYERHGIYREIPVIYLVSENQKRFTEFTLNNLYYYPEDTPSYTGYTYVESENNGYKIFQIGDADTYVQGNYVYVIDYTLKYAVNYFDDHDELYMNITGDSWEVPISASTVTIHLPAEATDTICYTGAYGSTEQNCSLDDTDKENIIVSLTQPLGIYEGFTVAVALPKGSIADTSDEQRSIAPTDLYTENSVNTTRVTDLTPEFSAVYNSIYINSTAEAYQIQVNTEKDFTGTMVWDSTKTSMTATGEGTRSSDISYAGEKLTLNGKTYYWRIKFWDNNNTETPWSDTAQFTMESTFRLILCNIGVLLPVPILFLLIPWVKKNGKNKKGTVIPNYHAPKDMFPILSGFLYSKRLQNKYITADIIDLAVRGYIKIKQISKKKYELIRTEKEDTDLEDIEKELLNGLFKEKESVEIDKISSSFYTTVNRISTDSNKELYSSELFSKDRRKMKIKLLSFGILTIVLGVMLSSWLILNAANGWFLGILFSGFVMIICSTQIDIRSSKGNDMYYELLGLRMYIDTAEEKRIEFHNDPKKYLGVFEKLLPYAMIFGLEKKWAKEFEDLYTTPPDWYVGDMNTFNTYMMVNSFNRMNSVIQTKSVQPGSSGGFRSSGGASGGSGFSGGSSGGGFGGGGGGSW